MTHEQYWLNKLMHDIRVLFKSDMVLMHYAEYYYPNGLATLDDVLMNAVKVSAAYRENGLGIDGKEKKHDTD